MAALVAAVVVALAGVTTLLVVELAPPAASASTPASASASASTPDSASVPASAAASPAGAAPVASSPSASTGAAPNSTLASQALQVQLTAAQLPAAAAENWTPVGTTHTRNLTGQNIRENECLTVDGANLWAQRSFAGGAGQNMALQDTYVFASASAAQSAYRTILSTMADCQAASRAMQATNKVTEDAVTVQTATQADAAAWVRTWTGVLGMSAQGPQTNHIYAAVAGPRLVILQFTEFPGQAAAYNVAADPTVLAELDTELAR